VLENCGVATIREAERRLSGEIHSSLEEATSKSYGATTVG